MNSHYRSCLGVGVGAEGAAVDGAPLAHRASARGHEQPVVGCLMIGSFMRIADLFDSSLAGARSVHARMPVNG